MSGREPAHPVARVADVDWDGLEIETRFLGDLGYEIALAPDATEENLVALAPQASIILVCCAQLTLGLVEMGRIGQAFARRALSRGMTVVYTSSQRALPHDITAREVEDRGEFLGASRCVSLHVTDPEPLPVDHPPRELAQCLITPHSAYRSSEALTELRERISQGARAHLTNADPAGYASRANPAITSHRP